MRMSIIMKQLLILTCSMIFPDRRIVRYSYMLRRLVQGYIFNAFVVEAAIWVVEDGSSNPTKGISFGFLVEMIIKGSWIRHVGKDLLK